MSFPDFSYEKKLWDRGYSLIIGVDEVGRGSLAGPVVAGACALRIKNYELGIKNHESENNNDKDKNIHDSCIMIPDSILKLGINDSKKLSAKKREKIEIEIKKNFLWATGEVGVGFINSFGIRAATEKAMRGAVVSLLYKAIDAGGNITSKTALSPAVIRELKPYLLIDAFHVRYIPVIGLNHQEAIIKGDQKSISIAAGSIIAKVYRDSLMKKLGEDYPDYGWDKNSGYGTAKHIEVIKKLGSCPLHRTKFIDGI